MKSAIPWILIIALLAGVFFLYSANKDKDFQLAKFAQDGADADGLRKENEELKKQSLSPEELARLKKDNEEVLRLRAEVQRLRDQAKQMNTQLATEQASQAQMAKQKALQLAAENQARLTEAQATADQQAAVQVHNHDVCVGFLRVIDAAKQQWALENKKTAADVPTAEDLTPYLPKDAALACPGGGAYSINAMNLPPTCTIAGHELK